jgi:glycosyltransferase involved in cell wall biosynthesis
MKPKVSIIVPIYNMEKYLKRCLESLVNQSLTEIEIILVNDGSTDKSAAIITEFERSDTRIKVLHKENEGVSSARNEGIKMASGEYIGFVDPDDWVNHHMYKKLYEEAQENYIDIVMCSYIRETGKFSKEKKYNLPEKVVYDRAGIKSNVLRRLIGPYKKEIAYPEMLDAWGTVWSKIYRSELIKNKFITFTDLNEIGTNEDSLFNIESFYYADSFVFVNYPYYHYWKSNHSSVTSTYKPKLKEQWMNLYKKIEDFIQEKKLGEEFQNALHNRICLGTLGLGLNTISKSNPSSIFNKISLLNNFLSEKKIQRSFKQFELAYLPVVWRAFYFCAKMRFTWGFYFLLMSIEWLRTSVKLR